MKTFWLVILTILSIAIMLFGFFHVPILANWFHVDVFALRGLFIFISWPIVGISAIPFATCLYFINKRLKNKENNKKV